MCPACNCNSVGAIGTECDQISGQVRFFERWIFILFNSLEKALFAEIFQQVKLIAAKINGIELFQKTISMFFPLFIVLQCYSLINVGRKFTGQLLGTKRLLVLNTL